MFSTIHRAPLALAGNSAVPVNLHHVTGDDDPDRLIALARELDAVVFIGIVATKAELKRATRRVDDAATAIAAEILGRHNHHTE